MSAEMINYTRAFLFGVTCGIACFYFFLYFKPITEELFNKVIPIDLWWWGGITVSIVVGALMMLILI